MRQTVRRAYGWLLVCSAVFAALSVAPRVQAQDFSPPRARASRAAGQRDAAVIQAMRRAAVARQGGLRQIEALLDTLRIDDFFHVEVLTASIEATIGAGAGTYALSEPVRFRISAAKPGWRILAEVSDLNGDSGEKIEAKEVYFQPEAGDSAALDTLTAIVEYGELGDTFFEMNLSLMTEGLHVTGTYKGALRVVSQRLGGEDASTIQIPFQVEVEYRITTSISNNKIYFHFADLPASQTATVNGAISADGPVNLIIEVREGTVCELPLQRPFGNPVHPFDDPIPVTWKLVEAGSAGARAPDQVSPGGHRASWELSGDTTYGLECTISPEGYQAPGDYGKEWTLIVAPRL